MTATRRTLPARPDPLVAPTRLPFSRCPPRFAWLGLAASRDLAEPQADRLTAAVAVGDGFRYLLEESSHASRSSHRRRRLPRA